MQRRACARLSFEDKRFHPEPLHVLRHADQLEVQRNGGMLPMHPPRAAALWWLSRKEATRFLSLSPFSPLEERNGLSTVLSTPG